MNNGVSMQPAAWGQVRVREPAGERVLGETLTIGGAGSDVVVPGVPAGAALSIRRSSGVWLVEPASGGSVVVEVHPEEARVRAPGALSLHLGGRLWVSPGPHRVRAEREGYLPAEAALVVHRGGAERLRLVLAKLPGQLQIDTAGVVAAVSIDGVAAGLAPGVISVPAGDRTISLRAPRYVDYTTTLGIEGAGARQELHVRLQPAWGTLAVAAVPQGAHVSVDGVDSGAAPVSVAAPSGVRRIRIAASGWKTWESSVVLKGGQALAVGPVTLGQPDAHLTVRSVPAGADVTIAGTHRGHTPLTVDRKSTRLNSSHTVISYAVFCLKKKKKT